MAADIVDSLLAGIAPWRCILCREPAYGMDICPDCINDLPWIGHACQGCSTPLPDSAAQFCGTCAGRRSAVDFCCAALAYEYPINRLVTGLKFHRKLACARVLGRSEERV